MRVHKFLGTLGIFVFSAVPNQDTEFGLNRNLNQDFGSPCSQKNRIHSRSQPSVVKAKRHVNPRKECTLRSKSAAVYTEKVEGTENENLLDALCRLVGHLLVTLLIILTRVDTA